MAAATVRTPFMERCSRKKSFRSNERRVMQRVHNPHRAKVESKIDTVSWRGGVQSHSRIQHLSFTVRDGSTTNSTGRGRCKRVKREYVSLATADSSLSSAAIEKKTGSEETGIRKLIIQVLAGLTTTLSMIPESLAFTFVAGVPPVVGLHAAATMALFASIFGSQHGIISGAAGATAVVLAPLVSQYGIDYLFAAVILCGVIQIIAGFCRLGKFIRLVPQPAMMGFVNGLAIVIGTSQFEQFKTASVVNGQVAHTWMSGQQLYTMMGTIALTMFIIQFWPKRNKILGTIPSPLAAIMALTGLVNFLDIPMVRTVGDLASIKGSLPSLYIPSVPVNFNTLSVVFPFALSVAAVGLIETLLTQQLVDEATETRSETHVECIGQGLANLLTGCLGGMGGCAMIGQSMINVNSGGRTRLSGISCSIFLALSIVAGSSIIEGIPTGALVGTMWMLVIDIFDKSTLKRLSKVPKTDSFVVALVTVITIFTNLAVAVAAGVIVSCLNFSWKSAKRITARRTIEENAYDGKKAAVFNIVGPLFFGSITGFRELFDPKREVEDIIVLDFLESRVWDSSALEAINGLVSSYKDAGKEIHLRHLSSDCRSLLTKAEDLYSKMNIIEVNTEEDPDYGVATDYDVLETADSLNKTA